jgi:hypothetical protein
MIQVRRLTERLLGNENRRPIGRRKFVPDFYLVEARRFEPARSMDGALNQWLTPLAGQMKTKDTPIDTPT